MRLTLRTMLAYLDNVLEPADAEVLGRKIRDSEFATGLVHRIHGVLRKLRMDAPRLDGKGLGNDPNTVAEYLDSTLPQDRVSDFERVCLESDKHLCEVAACHQILALVLGRPAEVPQELREKIYALGDPERMLPVSAATAASAEAPLPPPVAKVNGRPAEGSAEAVVTVPEYLRRRSGPSWTVFALTALAAMLLGIGVLRLMGPFTSQHPVARFFQRSASSGGGEAAVAASSSKASQAGSGLASPGEKARSAEAAQGAEKHAATAPAMPLDATARSEASPPFPESPREVPAKTTGESPEHAAPPSRPVTTAAPSAAPAAAASPMPLEAPPATATITAEEGVVPSGTSPRAEREERSVAATTPKEGRTPEVPAAAPAPAPGAAEKPTSEPREVGRYTSDGQLLATFEPAEELWYLKQTSEVLLAGERLVALPTYRPQIALPSAVQLTLAGEGELQMLEPGEDHVPRVAVAYGRILAVTAGRAGAQVELDLAGISGLLTLAGADAAVAIRVSRWASPGTDPRMHEGMPVVELYNQNGRVLWRPAGGSEVEIPPRHVRLYLGIEPPQMLGPFQPPEWTDARSISPIDRQAAVTLERALEVARPLNLSLEEMTRDRRVEIRALAARCLAALDDFDAVIRELNDSRQYSYWSSAVEALRQALLRGPETAGRVYDTLKRLRGPDAEDLFRLLWGYSPEQLAAGEAAKLVRCLEHEATDVRVLAFFHLQMITGKTEFYRPDRPLNHPQTRTAVQNWKQMLDKGQIVYRTPPSPHEPYRPLGPAEARPPAPAR